MWNCTKLTLIQYLQISIKINLQIKKIVSNFNVEIMVSNGKVTWFRNLGGRTRLTSSVTSVTRLTESKVPDAKSMIPPVGRATRPTTPFPTPLKNPPTPSSLAPSIGLVATPVTPSKMPMTRPFPPRARLSPKFCLPRFLIPSRRFVWNFSSKVSEARPLPSAPVILETVPAAPPMTPEKTLRTPMTTPSANSDGPSTAPWNEV